MANRQKYTRGALGHLCAHFERQKDENGNYIKFGNQDIDSSKSHLNYNLAAADQPLSQLDFIHKRIKECSCLNRKDVNVMMTWCVTLPAELKNKPKEEQEKFFKETYKFLALRYGKKNVISSYVHWDEETPHMHFAYTPVMYDKEKKSERFNAKVVGSKKDLNSFHKDIDKYLTEKMGYVTGVITGETEINLTIRQLKQLRKRELELEQKIKQASHTAELKPVMGRVKYDEVKSIIEENQVLHEALVVANEHIQVLEEQVQNLEKDRNWQKVQKLESELQRSRDALEDFTEAIFAFVRKFELQHVFEKFRQVFRCAWEYDRMNNQERMKYADNMRSFDQTYLPEHRQEKPIKRESVQKHTM